MVLRDYQNKSVEGIFNAWENSRSTILILPTGTGKTNVFCEVIRRRLPRKSMILVHRSELAYQAQNRLKSFGIEAGVEMGKNHVSDLSWNQQNVIISTIQTQISGNSGEGRMLKFKPGDFDTLIIDEAHHTPAQSWERVIDFYKLNPTLKVLGVTATPDRADEAALGRIFETVAFKYDIRDAIQDGWLVPIQQQMVTVESLDFTYVKTTAGDLNSKQLGEIMTMEKALHGVVSSTLDIIGNRRTLVFAVTVKQAEKYAEIFNRHRIGMADWVCGMTPKEERMEKLKQFDNGDIQVMVNVGVLTEGYDSPGVEVVCQARPTKSRSLYSQIVGRSTRPLPGIVDPLETPDERREAIAKSSKSHCLIIDFVGNSGRHKLMTTADILGGNMTDEVIARANKRAKEAAEPVDMEELMQEESERIQIEREERIQREMSRKAGLKGKAKFSLFSVNPFDLLKINREQKNSDDGRVVSPKQVEFLLKQGVDPTSMSYSEVRKLCDSIFLRFKNKLATLKQCSLLQKHGYDGSRMKMSEATQIIDALAKNGWKRPNAPQFSGIPTTPVRSSPKISNLETPEPVLKSPVRYITRPKYAEGELPF